MGMAQRTYGGIPDRKIRPIVTDFENGQFRNAMKQILQLEPKFPKSAYIPALKALVGEKMGKQEEALQWCLEAREKLLKDLPALTDDRMLNAVHAVCQKLGRMDIAISCYEYATDTVSSSLDFLYGLFNCYIRVSAFLKQQQTALKMYKLSGEEMYLMWAHCSLQLKVVHGTNSANLFPSAEDLIKKDLVAHCLLEPEALLVYISVLEQQGKYDTAREVLLESGANLLITEVDRLRIEGRLLARACDYAAAAEVFMRILQLCNDDWECFLDYLGCLLEDDSRWCSLTTSGSQTFPPRIVACKLDHLSDEEFDTRIAQASDFIQNLPAVTESMNMRGPYWAKIEIERRKRLRGKDNEMKEAIYDYFDRFGHLDSFVFDIEMFLQDFSKDELFELYSNLLTMTTQEESVAAFNKMVSISGVREWFGLMFKKHLQDTKKVNVHSVDLYPEMVKFSKKLDSATEKFGVLPGMKGGLSPRENEMMVKLTSGVQALQDANAAKLHRQNKITFRFFMKLTAAGSVSSVVGFGLMILWRKWEVAEKRREEEIRAQQQILADQQHNEQVAKDHVIMVKQHTPWFHSDWWDPDWEWLHKKVDKYKEKVLQHKKKAEQKKKNTRSPTGNR